MLRLGRILGASVVVACAGSGCAGRDGRGGRGPQR